MCKKGERAKILFSIVSIIILQACATNQTTTNQSPLALPEAFPMNSDFMAFVNDPDKFEGKEAAAGGKIVVLTESRKRPYFKIKLQGKEDTQIWSALLFKIGRGNGLHVGDNIRILGYYSSFEDGMKGVADNSTGHHLLTFCLVNLTTSETYFMSQAVTQCTLWKNGQVP